MWIARTDSTDAAGGGAGVSLEVKTLEAPDVKRPAHGAAIGISRVTKRYGATAAIEDVTLDIAAGELVTLLGPSGSGKTTLMMAIAGFVDGIEGEIMIDGRRIDHLPTHQRNLGVVFQHLALFPHMTVAENIAFPLRMRGTAAGEVRARVARALDLVKLPGVERRLPSELSGGQQQRVAFARAIVFEPKVLLLDEPLAALDKKLREEMQREIRILHRQLGITIINVTHDQSEALAVSDRIVVMNGGRVREVGTPRRLYDAPENPFVARFIGDSAELSGELGGGGVLTTRGGLICRTAARLPAGSKVSAVLRPERVLVGKDADGASNRFEGRIADIVFQGHRVLYEVALNDVESIIAHAPNTRLLDQTEIGQRLWLGWEADDMLVSAQGAA
jgi:putative spermidine/putrescine transport system ATP-binding protein